MEKEFVTYELAVKLKEIGFNEPCMGVYFGNGEIEITLRMVESGHIPCPTFSQAFRWFREKYGLRIRNYGSINYSGELSEYFEIFKYGYGTSDKSLSIEIGALTYEESELKCLEKLIEIVESKSE